MKKASTKRIWLGMLVMVLVFGVSLSGCTTTITVADPVVTKWIEPNPRDFIILGIIEFQQNQRKEISYADVLNHARESFPTANAVLDLRIEDVTRNRRSVYVATGIAIQYVSQSAGARN